MEHQQIVDKVLGLDDNIRFATICDMVGDIQVSRQKEGIEKFLTTEETERNLKQATKAWIHSRIPNYKKIGKGLYTLTVYEKLSRVTVPLPDGFLLLASIDSKGDRNQIIETILKQVRGNQA